MNLQDEEQKKMTCKSSDQNCSTVKLQNTLHQQNTINAQHYSHRGSHQQPTLSIPNYDVNNHNQSSMYQHRTQYQQNYNGYPQATIDYQCDSSNNLYNNNFTGHNNHPVSGQQPNLTSRNYPISATLNSVLPTQIHSGGYDSCLHNHQKPTQGVDLLNQHLGSSGQRVGLKQQNYRHQNQMQAQCLPRQQMQTNVCGHFQQQNQHPTQQYPLQQDYGRQNLNSSRTVHQNLGLNANGLFY